MRGIGQATYRYAGPLTYTPTPEQDWALIAPFFQTLGPPPCIPPSVKEAAARACTRASSGTVIKGLGQVGVVDWKEPCGLSTYPICPPGTGIPQDTGPGEGGEEEEEEEPGGHKRSTMMWGGILLLVIVGGYVGYRTLKKKRKR